MKKKWKRRSMGKTRMRGEKREKKAKKDEQRRRKHRANFDNLLE